MYVAFSSVCILPHLGVVGIIVNGKSKSYQSQKKVLFSAPRRMRTVINTSWRFAFFSPVGLVYVYSYTIRLYEYVVVYIYYYVLLIYSLLQGRAPMGAGGGASLATRVPARTRRVVCCCVFWLLYMLCLLYTEYEYLSSSLLFFFPPWIIVGGVSKKKGIRFIYSYYYLAIYRI